MNDNDQKRQMARAWDAFPIGRATKSIWVVLKYGRPAGSDGRDIVVGICDAERAGLLGFGEKVTSLAPANQYVKIPAMNGDGPQIRFSRDFVSVVANSYSAHLARMVESNMQGSDIPLDTALGVTLRSSQTLVENNPGLRRRELAQKVVLNGTYRLLVGALHHSPQYCEDLAAGRVVKDDIRVLRCVLGQSPEVVVSGSNGGQRSYSLMMDDFSLVVLHGEMSAMVSDCPLPPSLDFPLMSANYTAIFLKERGEVRLDVQWETDSNKAEDWSEKLVFK